MDAAESIGIAIPGLCRMKGLEPGASCFLCVVEVQGRENLLPSCAAPAEDGMVVITDSPRIREARRTALELLLSDHVGDCEAPCSAACPAGLDIEGFIREIRAGRNTEALGIILKTIPLPRALGRICARYCERVCRRRDLDEPVSICRLKRFAADSAGLPPLEKAQPTGRRVAVVGAGPAGLSAAFYLLKMGNACIIYDAMPQAGGLLRYAVPEFRLPLEALEGDVKLVENLGGQFRMGHRLGSEITLEQLRREHDAVLLAVGAKWEDGVPARSAAVDGIEFLRRLRLGERPRVGRSVDVLGGGGEACDIARATLRLGAHRARIICRIAEGKHVGDVFAEARAEGVEIVEEGTAAPDAETIMMVRPRVADMARLIALGCRPFSDKEMADRATLQTGDAGVFVAGEALYGAGPAVRAVASGRRAAIAIDSFLRTGRPSAEAKTFRVFMGALSDCEKERLFKNANRTPRTPTPLLKPRPSDFSEAIRGLSLTEAIAETERCIRCGCLKKDECGLRRLAAQYEAQPARLGGLKRSFERDDSHPRVVFEPGKCILCGICVRLCEAAGRGWGMAFIGRGFTARAAPPLGVSLLEALGDLAEQCAAACPTGALSLRPSHEDPRRDGGGDTQCGSAT